MTNATRLNGFFAKFLSRISKRLNATQTFFSNKASKRGKPLRPVELAPPRHQKRNVKGGTNSRKEKSAHYKRHPLLSCPEVLLAVLLMHSVRVLHSVERQRYA